MLASCAACEPIGCTALHQCFASLFCSVPLGPPVPMATVGVVPVCLALCVTLLFEALPRQQRSTPMCPWRGVAPELLVPTGLALLAAPVLPLPPSFHRCPPSVAALPPPGGSAHTCLVWPGILCGTRLVCLSAVLLVTTVHTLMMFSVLCMVRDVVCVRSAYAC